MPALTAALDNLKVRNVTYGDPGSVARTPELIDLATRKRRMFDYEREVRIIATADTPNPRLIKGEFGLEYPLDPESMLDAVVIHPEADTSFEETVVAAVGDYALALRDRVQWSAMREPPPLK
jgi:hypothetical protein